MSGPDDMPVLMSAPNADAPTLARLELGEDSISLELHHPSYQVGILEVGFKGGPHRFRLAETGYTLAVDPGEVAMFGFVVEDENGKRYRWYVHSENPTQTFIQINAHLEAKVRPKPDAAI